MDRRIQTCLKRPQFEDNLILNTLMARRKKELKVSISLKFTDMLPYYVRWKALENYVRDNQQTLILNPLIINTFPVSFHIQFASRFSLKPGETID